MQDGAKTRILIVGESVFKIHTHFKGFASYETGYITMSLDPFIERFAGTDLAIDFMPNHEVSLKFPFTVEELSRWDVIVISDAPADSFLLAPDTLAGKPLPNRLRVLGEWVKRGGGFAMIGGWMSFGGFHGKGHWAFSPITDLSQRPSCHTTIGWRCPRAHARTCSWTTRSFKGCPAVGPSSWATTASLTPAEMSCSPSQMATHCWSRTSAVGEEWLPFHLTFYPILDWGGYVPFWTQLFLWLARGRD